jgi:leader peptidase (prepilin peptidase) / N-methyltransferase
MTDMLAILPHGAADPRPVLVAALAAAGLVTGWALRVPVARLAVPPGEPSGTHAAADAPTTADPGSYPSADAGPGRRGRAAPPLVLELVTAALLGGLAARVHPGLVLAAACWLAVCCVALAWIDVSVQRLPDALTAPAYLGTMVLLLAAAAVSGSWPDLLRAVAGGLGVTVVLAAVAVISRSALGLGDAKLAASLGTMMAWFGWVTLVRGLVAGFVIGAVFGLCLLGFRRARLGARIAFGPFLIAGAFLAVLAGGG